LPASWLLAVAGFSSNDVQLVRSTYLGMELIGWYVLVPLCVASLVTGLMISLGTTWGLFRHYWVVIKFVITIVSSVILFMYTQTLEQLGDLARSSTLSIEALRNGSPVLHASAAIMALLVNTALSVYKPRGMTTYGRRKIESRGLREEPAMVLSSTTTPRTRNQVVKRAPRWVYVLGIHAVGLVVLFLIAHLTGGVPGH